MNVLVAIHSRVAAWTLPPALVDRLQREFPQHRFLHARNHGEALALAPEADVIFANNLRPPHIAAARRLRWIHTPVAGVGHLLFPELVESDVLFTNGRGMSADTIAEHVVGVTLALYRKLPQAVQAQQARVWAQDAIAAHPPYRMVAGSTALIVGLGAIGLAVARALSALGACVTGVKRRVPSEPPSGVTAVYPPERLRELLAMSDLVVLAAAETKDTRHLIGADELSTMPAHAVLVNVSRGALIDEGALVAALEAKRIGGAALDVFETEPLPPDHALWGLPNVLITPHTSGFRPDHWEAAVAIFADNLRRFDAGEPLLNVVDKEAGY